MDRGDEAPGDMDTPAGWLLVAERHVEDIDPMIERVGVVYRYPVADAERAARMEPGQPCFLVRSDPARVMGLWAVGEVVAPSTPPNWCAEVELLPLEKAIATAKLRAHEVLAQSVVTRATFADTPIPLTRREIRALESFDFWMVDPRPDQITVLDAIFEAEEST